MENKRKLRTKKIVKVICEKQLGKFYLKKMIVESILIPSREG